MARTLTDTLYELPVPPIRREPSPDRNQRRETTLVVENMHCGGCMRKVETALAAVPGVLSARVNLSARRVAVQLGERRVETPALVGALEAAGFKAAELAETEDKGHAAADRELLKRLAVAGFAAANIMLLSVSVWSGAHGDMSPGLRTLFHWLSALIALPAVAYAGKPFFASALTALKARRINMDVPISLGVSLATLMSLYQTARGTEQVYFDAAITLLFFLLIGRALDSRMRSRAAGVAANLLGLRATSAAVIGADGTTSRLAARDLVPGMRILTAAGERLAVDGRVAEGSTEIDESLISGETRPRTVRPGDAVYAGTVNLGQPIVMEAQTTGESTLLAEIARLMSAAEQGRASYVRLADRAARLYGPAVHILGLATLIGWLALGYGFEAALTAAVAVLIITCPCALALAVPAVQVAATSRLFSRGVLVKAPDALERLAEIDTVVLDKTGTLTLGEPLLSTAANISDWTLSRAATMAAASRHPYARAVVRAARSRGLAVATDPGVVETAGFGLSRPLAGGGEERLGSARFCGVENEAAADGDVASLWYRPGTGEPVPLPMEDRARPDARDVVTALGNATLPVELLSGDREAEVRRVAGELGIARFAAGVLPSEKLARLSALAGEGRKVLMIGDGLNDAPALAAAHASFSPSTAADISQTAADAVFQGEALTPVLEALAVAREVRRMSLQNFTIAIGYNIVFVPLAMIGLVTPLIAAIAMSASSIAVTGNAVRLRRKTLKLGSWRSS
jgi:Cu2+-exporting ATPase